MAKVEFEDRLKGEFVKPQDVKYLPGDRLDFVLQTLNPFSPFGKEVIAVTKGMEIANVAGGGFFGKVLIGNKDFVVKTPRPDILHEALRSFDWGFRPFPAQTNLYAAQLEHLSTRLIHKALPALTFGKFYSPDSLGYTELPSGFCQVVEKVKGRGPRFDLEEDEFLKFKKAQEELLEIGLRLGLEQIGQVHPDNPFGMANLWYDSKNQRWIWMDTIPVIPHNMPFLYQFHRDIREYFKEKKPTFNRIHTEYFMNEVKRNKGFFSEQEYEEIEAMVRLYDNVWQEYQENKDQGRDLTHSAKIMGQAALDVAIKTPKRIVKKLVVDPVGITFFDGYRKKEILKGADQARKLGLLEEDEWMEAVKTMEDPRISSRDKTVIKTLLGFYGSTYILMKTLEGGGYFMALQEQNPILGAASFLGGLVVPPVVRYLGTRGIGLAAKTDLRAAAFFSAIPGAGNVAPIPAHIAYLTGSRSKVLWHSFLRDMVAGLSKIKPEGGWGTDLEAKLWKKIGVHMEKLAEFSNKEQPETKIVEKHAEEIIFQK